MVLHLYLRCLHFWVISRGFWVQARCGLSHLEATVVKSIQNSLAELVLSGKLGFSSQTQPPLKVFFSDLSAGLPTLIKKILILAGFFVNTSHYLVFKTDFCHQEDVLALASPPAISFCCSPHSGSE